MNGLQMFIAIDYDFNFFICIPFQDGLLAKCAEMMIENLNSESVCRHHAAAVQYGQLAVEMKCIEWLERRLTSSATVELLNDLKYDLPSLKIVPSC